jgi:hypothetical protein
MVTGVADDISYEAMSYADAQLQQYNLLGSLIVKKKVLSYFSSFH